MQSDKILSASLIDIIFDGRNKSYGAYELRSSYSRRITKSLLIMTGIISVGILLSFAPKKETAVESIISPVSDSVKIVEIRETPPKPLVQALVEPVQSVRTASVPYTQMIIVEDNEVTEDVTTIEELAIADISTTRFEGERPGGIVDNPVETGTITGIIEVIHENTEPLSVVEIQAKFEGNWENFLRKNLNPQVAVDNDAPPGNHTIIIQFVVDKDGTVSDIKPLTNLGYGMEQEAMRVLKKAAKWKPAIQNGHAVTAYRSQPITFQVLED